MGPSAPSIPLARSRRGNRSRRGLRGHLEPRITRRAFDLWVSMPRPIRCPYREPRGVVWHPSRIGEIMPAQLDKRFTPKAMRVRSNGSFRSEEHRRHCENGGNPNPAGASMLLGWRESILEPSSGALSWSVRVSSETCSTEYFRLRRRDSVGVVPLPASRRIETPLAA
jgi:hypothetical protein